MNSEPDWPPVKSDREAHMIAFQILRCLEGLNLQQADYILGGLVPRLLRSAHVVELGAINRLEADVLSPPASA
jgi:hypothetical protein